MNGRRALLLGVAGLLSGSALLAIGILLAGRFGETERRILATTMLLAVYGLVALPGVVLLDQGRRRLLALATVMLTTLAAGLALASVWALSDVDALGKSVGTATVLAVAAAQSAALAARRQDRDPRVVRSLYAASCATVALAAAAVTALVWAEPNDVVYARLLGALVVLDLLLVALQPVLARARPSLPAAHHFAVVLASGEVLQVAIDGGDLATAAARAIRAAERGGAHVVRLDVTPAP